MNDELYSVRLRKLERLVENGLLPYADQYDCTHTVEQAMQLPDGAEARTAGRVMAWRDFGKLIFADLKDRTDTRQISFKEDSLSDDEWWLLQEVIDIGDFIGVGGTMWTSRTGERTLNVETLKFLSKSLRPLPEKWHGITDEELLYRKRYLDLLMNEETKQRFETRTRILKCIRRFLDDHGFLEVETPTLQAAASGASARPFVTHHHALDQDFYLRISPETYLKRLVVGGLERVYELGKNFRNEGMDASHLQEFTMLEWYAAYWNYEDNMRFIKELLQYTIEQVLGTTVVEYQGTKLDFGGDWARVDYRKAVQLETGIDVLEYESRHGLAQEINRRLPKFDTDPYKSLPSLIDMLYKRTVRPDLIQPTFLMNHPTVLVPLARRTDDHPEILDMFQVVINSWELVKSYSELIDPLDQRRRMLRQQSYREQGDEETMMMEGDYIECMEHGMPPNSGLGLGIDRLVALLTDASSLRDVVFFPKVRTLET